MGDPDRAIGLGLQAIALADSLVSAEPHNQAYQNEAIKSRIVTGLSLAGMGDGQLWLPGTGNFEAAERIFAEATRISEAGLKIDPNDARSTIRTAIRISDEALVREQRSPHEALPLYERSLALFASTSDDFRKTGFVRENELVARCAIATIYAKLGRAADAKASARLGLELASYDPFALAMCEVRVGQMDALLGDHASAIAHFESAVRTLRSIDEVKARIGLADALDHLARLQLGACKLHRQAALDAWRSKPIATAYVRRVDTLLAARLKSCP
jgi:tetratricopeptide (TPR) repeat protein